MALDTVEAALLVNHIGQEFDAIVISGSKPQKDNGNGARNGNGGKNGNGNGNGRTAMAGRTGTAPRGSSRSPSRP